MNRTVLLIASALLATSANLHATPTFTIGNSTPTTVYYIQGQSFTAANQGNAGTGSDPASGTVYLQSFGFSFNPGTVDPTQLYLYSFQPTVTQAATGIGSLATGADLGGGTYSFSNVALNAQTKYYAVLPTSQEIFDGSGNTYTGGLDLYPQGGIVAEGASVVFDAGFTATFTTSSTAAPEPSSLLLALSGVSSIAWRYRRKRS